MHNLFNEANAKLNYLRSFICSSRTISEAALKFDTLVGDIEDALSCTTDKNLRNHSSTGNSEISTLSQSEPYNIAICKSRTLCSLIYPHQLHELRMLAIRTLKMTEELTSITRRYPQCKHLVSVIDHRVDRALAILRPHAILLIILRASLGWPPPLSALNSDVRNANQVLNPLLSMQTDLKLKYFENFLALCNLQELQKQRKARQLLGHNREVALQQPLWAFEELVNPKSLTSQHHFSKWVGKHEFTFTLVKITKDYVNSMDELLQPLVDKAKLVGYRRMDLSNGNLVINILCKRNIPCFH